MKDLLWTPVSVQGLNSKPFSQWSNQYGLHHLAPSFIWQRTQVLFAEDM